MMRLAGQVAAYAAFALLAGTFSAWPAFRMLAADEAMVSLTFSHAGQRVGECRRLSQAELEALPPNMRKPDECPRERHPVRIEFRSDDVTRYSAVQLPSGLWRDGKANVYRRIRLPAGRRQLFVGMNDSGGEGFDVTATRTVQLEPGRNLVIRFDPAVNGFVFE